MFRRPRIFVLFAEPKGLGVDNYASSLVALKRLEETKPLLRKMIPVARRVLGDSYDTTLRMRTIHAAVLYSDTGTTLDDLRESVTTLEDMERTARRVFGGAHPLVATIAKCLRNSRAALDARETSCTCVPVPPPPS